MSTHKEREKGKEDRVIIFGAEPICIECGERHNYSGNISCCNDCEYCEICGERIRRGDVYWGGTYGDTPYCEHCCTWCEICETYHPNENVEEIDGINVCTYCIEEYYYTCQECGSIHHLDDMDYDRETEAYYCEECYNRILDKRETEEKTKTEEVKEPDSDEEYFDDDDPWDILLSAI